MNPVMHPPTRPDLSRRPSGWTARAATLALAGLSAVLLGTAPAAAADCAPGSACQENPRFSASLNDFRVLQTGTANRPISVSVRFRNKTAEPLVLTYVDDSAAAIDDQGHRYAVASARTGVRGLGVATRREFDPRFTLGPGESADARLELTAYITGIYGTRFDLDFAVREVEPLAGGQARLGRETLLRYTGLQDGLAAPAPASLPAPVAAPGGGAVADAGADPCQGQPNCVVNGPLAARVARLQAEAPRGNNQGVVVTVSFSNLSTGPMVLNYKQGSGSMLDEHGQRYEVDWRDKASASGMPVSTRQRASSGFTLAPGESRQAQFRYTRYVGKTQLGRQFSPSLAVEQYELLPSNQLRLLREYALDFGPVQPGVAGAAAGAAAGAEELVRTLQGLGELFKKK